MRVVRERDGLALCIDEHGEHHEVALDLIERAGEGDRVLVHAGVAIGALQ
jgi:hydrogenase maturation factor